MEICISYSRYVTYEIMICNLVKSSIASSLSDDCSHAKQVEGQNSGAGPISSAAEGIDGLFTSLHLLSI